MLLQQARSTHDQVAVVGHAVDGGVQVNLPIMAQGKTEFVTELDTSHEVAVYAKLPRGFFIPTPVGDYNPDWAIAFTEGSVKHVYFVAETKGSLSTLQLKGVEDAKIECARKFFASLSEKNGNDVTYDVVTDYTELMQLVSGG